MNERHKEILQLLQEQKEISVNLLSEHLGVSGVTIRQDLSQLETQGLVKRVHGGAVLNDTDDISTRLVFHYNQKITIARKAASMINDGETVLLEAGSTNAVLAKELTQKKGLTIVTPNVFIARELREYYDVSVILLGGVYQHQSESLIGTLTKLCIDHLNFHKAFIGVDGFTPAAGFTGKDMMRAEIIAYIVQKSPQVFVVTDSSKFGKMELTRYFGAEDVDYVVTDKRIPTKERAFLEQAGVKVVLA
ncbi:DeoR family transcriptional regulator [candidate division KSB3 bacterium]|uniref:DeoR family transcriptional regulator n=1 Tax=candidate division KSB3 bacterium TaxID=2044937 RepID=A0A2G6KJ51_9BACT|nr:MAG: DeoR family transcriptional regulator [candidate division KSB3 bacterium]